MKGAAIANESKALSGLRGIAVAFVVVSHLGNAGIDLISGLRLNAIGKAGVFLFFSLSAYLLTAHLSCLLSGPVGSTLNVVGKYAINRFFRIFPLLSIVLVVHWIWGDLDFAGVLRHLVLVEGMGELWAIPVEFQYYLAIPFVALLVAKRGTRIASGFLIVALLASVVLSSMWPSKVFSNDLDLVTRLPAFLAGSLVAVWLPKVRGRTFESAFFAGAVALAGAASTYAYRAVALDDSLTSLAPTVAVLLACAWSCALLGGCHENGILARILAIRPLALLGRISFGVYLWHMFAIRLWLEHGALPKWAAGWIVVAITIAIATATYVVVERPGILLGRRLGNSVFKENMP